MPPTQKKIRIGCAGWSIPSRHAPLFGDGDSHLARYATRFDVAEINSTFYRPHQPRTFERWAASVPASFRFSVKLPRAITPACAWLASRGIRAGSCPRRTWSWVATP